MEPTTTRGSNLATIVATVLAMLVILALGVGAYLLLSPDRQAPTGGDVDDRQVSLLALFLVWNDMPHHEQVELCDGYELLGERVVVETLRTDNPELHRDDIVDHFERECALL